MSAAGLLQYIFMFTIADFTETGKCSENNFTIAGKTTAVDILLGLLKSQVEQVLADGVDVTENMQGWLAHIGYIPWMISYRDCACTVYKSGCVGV